MNIEELKVNNKKVKVAKLIWWIPHYRVPIFRRLSQNPFLDFVVVAGDNSQFLGGAKVASANEVGNEAGVNWKTVRSFHVKGPFFHDYEWQPDAVRYVWKQDLDAVICLGNKSLSNWLVRIICRLRGIPLIEWTIGVMGPEKKIKWAIRKFYMKWAKAHLLYGNFAREWYVTHGFKPEELFVVYNSLEYDEHIKIRSRITKDEIRAIREQFGVSGPDDRFLFHSGRLEKKKNLPILFDALKQLKMHGKNVKLVLIGSGREEGNLKSYVKESTIEDRVIFYGPCYDENVLGQIITASDLCVVTGVTGLIAMHSLVYGTPILTRENSAHLHGPEVEAVVEGKTGRYFRDGDLEDLVRKAEEMLYPEPAKAKMAQNCMNIIDKYYNPQYQERIIIKALNYVLPTEKQIPEPE